MIAHSSLTVQLASIVALVAVSTLYLLAWSARATRLVPAVAWVVAVVALAVADSPPVQRFAERTFTGHMVQHLVILCVAGPAFVLARPFEIFGRCLPPRIAGPVRRRARGSSAVIVVRPLVAVVVLVAIHLTPIYEAALRSPVTHVVEHAGFLAAGCLLWGAVLAPVANRGAARVASAFGVTAVMSLLGMVIATSTSPISSTYAARQGVDAAVRDQRLGASLMWVGGMALTLPLVVVAMWRWASAEERTTRRREELARAAHVGAADGTRPEVRISR